MNDSETIWPAIIKYADDDELDFIDNQQQWNENIAAGKLDLDGSDVIIDSEGRVYSLNNTVLAANGKVKTLEDVLGLVKAHAAQAGSCCVAKLYAPSILDAFTIVKSLSAD